MTIMTIVASEGWRSRRTVISFLFPASGGFGEMVSTISTKYKDKEAQLACR